MSRDINKQSLNKVNVRGKLLEAQFSQGKTKNGKPYESAKLVLRVTQTYSGIEETSDVPVRFFASQFTAKGASNPGYDAIQQIKKAKSAQVYGIDEADVIDCTCELEENNFVSRSGRQVNGWELRGSFPHISSTKKESAVFSEEIFIWQMKEEMDNEEEPTGRLILKGGIVGYGGKLSIVDFVVEHPDYVDYISRNYHEHDTVMVKGYVRFTSKEVEKQTESSWGEDIPETNTVSTRELVITKGVDEPYDEDNAYDEMEMKKANNARKARIEQLLIDAKSKASAPTKKPAPKASDWDDGDF